MKVSIVTVTYNSVETLTDTIESVLAQQDVDLEYLIIDGASTDGTVEVIKQAAALDGRIRWISEPDEGIYDAMNKGWAMASPDSHVLYLGAGDLVKSLPKFEKDYDPDVVLYGDVMKGEKLFCSRIGFELCLGNTLHHQALLVPKKLHPSPPFNQNFKIYADFDFNQRLLKAGAEFIYSPSFRSYAMPDGVSCRKDRLELFRIIKKNYGYACALMSIMTIPWRRLNSR